MNEQFARARAAARALMRCDRNALLASLANALSAARETVLAANARDVAEAIESGFSAPLIDRLALDQPRYAGLIDAVTQVRALPDPLGRTRARRLHANGLEFHEISAPIGVIGMVYESRPNVTVDAAVLGLKAGSAMLLRGSLSARYSNAALIDAMRAGIQVANGPIDAVQMIDPSRRETVTELLHARGKVDLVIPRGGAGLIAHVVEHARVPVIETGTGVCHLYVHASADIDQAVALLLNGKVQRPGVCNALETLLIDRTIEAEFLPVALAALAAVGVEVTSDADDFGREFLDLKIAVRIVDDLDDALAHIARYGTQHTEVIAARDAKAIDRFLNEVDAAAVYANASSRFTDGFEYGLGAEIGISTQKLHARGPMGLDALVTSKTICRGGGQVRG
jgi:glutamate-5-semialdehyde dehydrogenase